MTVIISIINYTDNIIVNCFQLIVKKQVCFFIYITDNYLLLVSYILFIERHTQQEKTIAVCTKYFLEDNKMERQENETFEVRFGNEGDYVSLNLPMRLCSDFENCVGTEEGRALLCSIFKDFSALSEENKRIFQFSIYNYSNEIIDMADLRSMMNAYKTVILRETIN